MDINFRNLILYPFFNIQFNDDIEAYMYII